MDGWDESGQLLEAGSSGRREREGGREGGEREGTCARAPTDEKGRARGASEGGMGKREGDRPLPQPGHLRWRVSRSLLTHTEQKE